jgi:hypothetical protein
MFLFLVANCENCDAFGKARINNMQWGREPRTEHHGLRHLEQSRIINGSQDKQSLPDRHQW